MGSAAVVRAQDEDVQREFQTVVLAALLHDLGIFLQHNRTGFAQPKEPWADACVRFIASFETQLAQVTDVALLCSIVRRCARVASDEPDAPGAQTDNEPQPRASDLAWLVSAAAALSASEPGSSSRQTPTGTGAASRLVSSFASLDLGPDMPNPLAYRFAALGAEGLAECFPAPDAASKSGDVAALADAFVQEFRALARVLAWDDFHCVCSHLLALLHKYTWCVPADAHASSPDVSLFDYLRTTATIAGCLYHYHTAGGDFNEAAPRDAAGVPRFVLAVGDLSGIQSYLYDLANVGAGGLARRLRARSLFIQLLGDAAAHRVVRTFGLPLHHIVLQAGGKFYALLPNLPDIGPALEAIQAKLDAWCLEELHGELAVNLGWVTCDDSGFQDRVTGNGFGSVLAAAGRALAERKRRRLAAALQRDGVWMEDAFVRPVDFGGAGACASCGRLPRRHDDLCAQCTRDTDVGAGLPAARYLAFWDGAGGLIALPGASASLLETGMELRGRPYLVQRLNAAETGSLGHAPAGFRWLATHVPVRRDGTTADFDWIAQQARGRQLLGVVKLDADRMGEAFVFGLKREPPAPALDSIARLATLSRQLEVFFAGWVQRLAQTDFPAVYVVYGGGDDLLAVAPWDQALACAERLAADYARFTGHPQLTISGGIALLKPRTPIGRVAREADDLLEASKRAGRGRLTGFGATLPWSTWPEVSEDVATLLADEPPTTVLHRLRDYGDMWAAYREHGKTEPLRMQPLLAYTLSRTIDPQRHSRLYAWARDLVGLRPGDSAQYEKLDRLALVAGLAALSRRRRSE